MARRAEWIEQVPRPFGVQYAQAIAGVKAGNGEAGANGIIAREKRGAQVQGTKAN